MVALLEAATEEDTSIFSSMYMQNAGHEINPCLLEHLHLPESLQPRGPLSLLSLLPALISGVSTPWAYFNPYFVVPFAVHYEDGQLDSANLSLYAPQPELKVVSLAPPALLTSCAAACPPHAAACPLTRCRCPGSTLGLIFSSW